MLPVVENPVSLQQNRKQKAKEQETCILDTKTITDYFDNTYGAEISMKDRAAVTDDAIWQGLYTILDTTEAMILNKLREFDPELAELFEKYSMAEEALRGRENRDYYVLGATDREKME